MYIIADHYISRGGKSQGNSNDINNLGENSPGNSCRLGLAGNGKVYQSWILAILNYLTQKLTIVAVNRCVNS